MTILTRIAERFKPKRTDVVGLDIASTALKAVRMRKNASSAVVTAAVMLPPLDRLEEAHERALNLPRNLKARYVSIALSGQNASLKLFTIPGHFDESAEAQISEYMGLENPSEYRLGYKVVSADHGESRVLAVALPEAEAAAAIGLFPHGLPAPCSLEVSGLAAMTAFVRSPAAAEGHAVGVIDFGAKTSVVAFFNKRVLALVRKLDIGSETLLNRVSQSLGVDTPTAEQILSDGSFDISQALSEVMDPFVKQLIISRDFVERREDCRIGRIHVTGGVVASRNWANHLKKALGVELASWNPFEGLAVEPQAIPEPMRAHESRFAAAVGAALATLEES